MTRALVLLALLLAAPAVAAPASPGVGLGLFASDPEWDYGPLIQEIAQLGVDGVLVVVPWYQETVHSTLIRPLPGSSPSLDTVKRTMRQLSEAGLAVSLMPIVLLETQENPKQWRGVIEPQHLGRPDTARWFASYRDFVLAHAVLAGQVGAQRFLVGSELLSLEEERPRWMELIGGVRAVFKGQLGYSANWDRYDQVTFWDALDFVGVNGYFRLARDGAQPSEDALVRSWEKHLVALQTLRDAVGLPLLMTEVGYSSRVTAAAKPWCACPTEERDHDLQARLYGAFLRVALAEELDTPVPFDAWFLWNWFGFGGPNDGTFTPRGKPAETLLRSALQSRR